MPSVTNALTVDFYIFKNSPIEAYLHRLCALVQKAYLKYNAIGILCVDETQEKSLDDLLWTFEPGSFLPHGIANNKADFPIVLSSEVEALKDVKLCINLKAHAPSRGQYERLVEWVYPSTDAMDLARVRYRHYQEQGALVNRHFI
jgi:DNA polymerase-3 subunit chi